MTAPGPPALGRGVVINAGAPVPPAWATAPVVTVDEAALADPGPAVIALHEAWTARRPVVVALAVDPNLFRSPASWEVEPWTLSPSFEAWTDRLQFLVWANTYDARGEGAPARPLPPAPPRSPTPTARATWCCPTAGRRGWTAGPVPRSTRRCSGPKWCTPTRWSSAG